MIKINEVVIVEGKYDKIKLSSIIDAPIITTDGFEIFKNKQKMNYIREVAKVRGIVILTDSDSAGFLIRRHIMGSVPTNSIKNAYIPDVIGKEKRKEKASKEGKLGVEGVAKEVIIEALRKAGVNAQLSNEPQMLITKSDLYDLGLIGSDNSSEKRKQLQKKLQLPERMSTKALLEAMNIFLPYDEWLKLKEELTGGDNGTKT